MIARSYFVLGVVISAVLTPIACALAFDPTAIVVGGLDTPVVAAVFASGAAASLSLGYALRLPRVSWSWLTAEIAVTSISWALICLAVAARSDVTALVGAGGYAVAAIGALMKRG